MNVEKIRALAAHLRRQDMAGRLNMTTWFSGDWGIPIEKAMHDCGTTACIAGWAVALEYPNVPARDLDFYRVGACILELNGVQADELFDDPDFFPTNEQAAATLDHLAETGEVRWLT